MMSIGWEAVLQFLVSSAAFFWNYRGVYESRQQWYESYDFIVVGGGSGGATVAARLSEVPQVNVLLLESGGEANEFTDITYIHNNLLFNNVTWFYPTVPQKAACFAYNNRISKWGGGHILGGSGVHNAAHYVRGSPSDFNEWVSMGAKNWSADVALEYFKKSEDNRIHEINHNGFHGIGGQMAVDRSPYRTSLETSFLDAARDLGYNIGDYNGADQLVFDLSQLNLRDGRRESSESAFLRAARKRPNLHVLTFAHVTRVLFDRNKRAIGVQFDRLGESYKVFAQKEVILSAGTVNSAKLLMLSGVGPANDLAELGIPVIADLPVGQNLQERIYIPIVFTTNSTETMTGPRDLNLENYRRFQEGQGVLTTSGCQAAGFVKTKYSDPLFRAPDIEYQFVIRSVASPGGEDLWIEGFNGRKDVYQRYFKFYEDSNTINVFASLMKPQSIGYMTLSSTDPYENPIIDPKFLTAKIDVLHLMEGIKMILEFTGTHAFHRHDVRALERHFPGCEGYNLWSNDYLECYIRSYTFIGYHNVGTCRMGDPRDPKAVVDPTLLVLGGISGLRVVDASVMPRLTRGNTNAPTIMIGERAADFIKQHWRL